MSSRAEFISVRVRLDPPADGRSARYEGMVRVEDPFEATLVSLDVARDRQTGRVRWSAYLHDGSGSRAIEPVRLGDPRVPAGLVARMRELARDLELEAETEITTTKGSDA